MGTTTSSTTTTTDVTRDYSRGNTVKMLVIGDVNTGKTSIIQRYVYKTLDESHQPTLGVYFSLKRVRIEDTLLNVQLWDIAGQERFIGLSPTYYKHAVAAIIVFDITSSQTLDNAAKWKADVDDKVFLRNGDNVPVVLFANKWNLIEEKPSLKAVTDDEIDEFCHENNFIAWFATSHETGLNIKKGMNFLITKIWKNKKKLDGSIPKNDHELSKNTNLSDKNVEKNEKKKENRNLVKKSGLNSVSERNNKIYLSQIEEKLNSVKNEILVSDNQNKSQLLDTNAKQPNNLINNESLNEIVTNAKFEYGENEGELDDNNVSRSDNIKTSSQRVKLMLYTHPICIEYFAVLIM